MNKTEIEKLMQGCLALICLPIFVLIGGIAVKYMWNTVIVATFELPALTLAQAIGLDVFISYIMPTVNNKNTDYTIYDTIGNAIFKTVFFVLIVFIVSFFV